ncbi:MAG: DNA polymerase III subunit alpha [Bacilli bacterium]|nr:DNA polymerase III subunit alpha [Bacilli bacterium]
MSFIPLHLYSGFSYLKSALVAANIPLLAKKYGYSSIGLTDDGSLSGYAPFFHASEKAGVTPIFGMDINLNEVTLSLFVESEEGYRNLLKLTKLSSEHKMSFEKVKEYAYGLALVITVNPSYFERRYVEDSSSLARSIELYTKPFTHSYFGLPYLPHDPRIISHMREFALSYSHNLVAFPHILYEKEGDAIAIEIVHAISEKRNLEIKEKKGDEHFLKEEEFAKFYSKEEMERTLEIASFQKDFKLISKRGGLLRFPNDLGLSSPEYLTKLANEGLEKKSLTTPIYKERLAYELDVIIKMGYADYFLIVWDYVNWSKTHDVPVGPGRGSGAGSLVSFALGIVGVDPIKYGLVFERFLNPERVSLPDIDVDFADDRRDLTVRYIQSRYGLDHVGYVLTTQTIKAQQALRDIGRVYGYRQNEIELVISTIMDPRLTLREDYKTSKSFKELVDSDKHFLEYVALASKIEGLPRQAGLHAAGIVINDSPLEDCLPVMVSEGVGSVACLEKDYLEEQGFLKMDILGLTNLTIIDNVLRLVKRDEGITLKAEDIPYDDEESIKIISSGKTMGLFQLESAGMKKAIKTVLPSSFQDVAAILALFRPGPMESIPSYARRKHGEERITYLAKELEPILKETYGVIVYQEQIMQIVKAMAGFSNGQADLFRRAISKKNMSKLEAQKEEFIKGCLANGKDLALSNKVFDLIFRFANYGFNKAHAFGYAVLSCQMAYLKTHFPKQFYSVILASQDPATTKFKDTLSEVRALGLHLAVPDINKSEESFVTESSSIRFPLTAIKGIGGQLSSAILDERRKNGEFTDIFDFAARIKPYGNFTLPALVRLIDAGALDSLHPSRNSLRASAAAAISYSEMMFGENGQSFLLDLGIEKPLIEDRDDDPQINLAAEYEALGIMVSGSPLSFYEAKLKEINALPLGDISSASGSFVTAGIVKSIRAINTKTGKKMAFMELYDDLNEGSFIIFDEVFNNNFVLLKSDAPLYIKAHLDSRRKDETSYVVEEVHNLGE